jgi:hypothetical protein
MADASGIPALLSDLGQVLHTMDCLNNSQGRASSIPLEGPGAWGGVAAGILHHHTGNPDLLTSTLQVAEGLLEYAQAQGLTETVAVVTASAQVIQQQLGKLKGWGAAGTASSSECSSEQHQHQCQQLRLSPGQQQQQQSPTLKQSAAAVLFGFKDGSEAEYALWVNRHCSLLVNTWRPIFLLWLLVSGLRSVKDGDDRVLDHLPVHLLLAVPCIVGMVAAVKGHYR